MMLSKKLDRKPGSLVTISGCAKAGSGERFRSPPTKSIGLRIDHIKEEKPDVDSDWPVMNSRWTANVFVGEPALVVATHRYSEQVYVPHDGYRAGFDYDDDSFQSIENFDVLVVTSGGMGWVITDNLDELA